MPNTVQVAITASNNTALPELKKTEEAVVHLSTTAQGQIGGMGRFSTALSRLERREPGMILRELRSEVVNLGASALGTTGPMGRLATSMGFLLPGGLLTITAVGAFAAIGEGIKQTIDFTNTLDEQLRKVNDRFAALVPRAKQLQDLGDLQAVLGLEGGPAALEKSLLPEQPGMFARALSRIQGLARAAFSPHGEGAEGDVEQAFVNQTAAALKTVSLIIQRTSKQIADETTKQEQERQRVVLGAELQFAKASGASAARIEFLQEQLDALKDAADKLAGGMTTQIRLFGDLHEITAKVSAELPAISAAIAHITVDLAGLGGLTKPAAALLPSDVDLKQLALLPGGLQGKALALANIPKTRTAPSTTTGSGFMQFAEALPGILASMTGGGGPGGIVTGFGGALTSLSGVKSLGLAGLGPLGAALSVGGGLLSLFGGGGNKLHVTIDSYERQALDQMKELRADPATRDVILVNSNDPRLTLYQSGRLGRRDATSRGP